MFKIQKTPLSFLLPPITGKEGESGVQYVHKNML